MQAQKRENVAYARPALAISPLSRECPRCGASVGYKCGRATESRGWVTLAIIHTERKRKQVTK